jgi:hypothetical protein
MVYHGGFRTVLCIRVDGFVEASARPKTRAGALPKGKGHCCALLSPNVSKEGWLDRADGHYADDTYELFRSKPSAPDKLFARICTASTTHLEGDGHRITGSTLIAGISRRFEAKCCLMHNLSTANEFEIWVDLTPHGTIDGIASVLRFTCTSHDHGQPGDRIPAIVFRPGTTQLEVTMDLMNGPATCCVVPPTKALPLRRTSRVVVRFAGDQLSVFIDGAQVARSDACTKDEPQRANVSVWAGDEYNAVADVTMSNLIYLPLHASSSAAAAATAMMNEIF